MSRSPCMVVQYTLHCMVMLLVLQTSCRWHNVLDCTLCALLKALCNGLNLCLLGSTVVWAYLLIKQVTCFWTFSVVVVTSSVLRVCVCVCVCGCVGRRYRARHDGWSQRGNLTDPVFVGRLERESGFCVQ
jgi:hypothetical protein